MRNPSESDLAPYDRGSLATAPRSHGPPRGCAGVHRANTAAGGLRSAACLVLALALAVPLAAWAQGPPPAVREAVSALMGALQSNDDATLETFASDRLTEEYRADFDDGGIEHLRELRETVRGSTANLGLERRPEGIVLLLSGASSYEILTDLDMEAGRFRKIELLSRGEAPDPATDRRAALRAHEGAIEGLMDGPQVYDRFADEHLAAELRSSLGEQGLHALLDRIRTAFARAGAIALIGGDDDVRIRLQGGDNVDVVFQTDEEPPFLIRSLRVEETAPEDNDDPDVAPISWDNLAARLDEEAATGFAGTVIAIRDGEVVLDASYGMADREAGRRNTSATIYDIGSVPFDFTRGAVFLLLQRGELALDDPITEFLPDVPDDKRGITIRHLLLHESGLANFHDRPGDRDADLAYIDRETAERRILERPLLFEPGTDREVSHSAFGLLAAIVERASGVTYQEFLKDELFEPAGMTRTGFYGEDLDWGPEEFAVGYGQVAASPNIPPNWGRASWLVMGSGGMFSTPADLRRYFEYLRSGGGLEGETREMYLDRAFVTGGSDRGFMAAHAWDKVDSMIFFATNSADDYGRSRALLRRLMALATGEGD